MAMQHEQEELSLVPFTARSQVVMPIASPAQMIEAIKAYEAMKAAIILERDTTLINGKRSINKSGWLRIARAFNISCFAVSSTYVVDKDAQDWGYEVVVRAMHPNGAEMQGDGACWFSEKIVKPKGYNGGTITQKDIEYAAKKTSEAGTKHNVRAHAFTRATNRAISNLVGGGEVSAEELSGDYVDADESPVPQHQPQRPPVRPMTPAQPTPKPAAKAKTLPHWKTLERRANYVNISSPTGWEELCRTLTGKDDAHTYTMEDYDTVERDIQEREAEAQAQHELGGGETTGHAPYFTDDPAAPIGTSTVDARDDLSTVGVGAHPAN